MIDLKQLKAGDTVWWEAEDGKQFLAKVEKVYANVVDLVIHHISSPFLESTAAKNPRLVEPSCLHPAYGTAESIQAASVIASSVRKLSAEVARKYDKPLDETQEYLVEYAVIHAYLEIARTQGNAD